MRLFSNGGYSFKSEDIIFILGTGASGAAALIYEMVWQRALSNTIGGNIYSFSTVLAAFMAGLAIGAHYGGAWAAKRARFEAFGLIQLSVGIFGVITFYLIANLETVYGNLFYSLRAAFGIINLAQLALVFLVMVVPTIFMGAVFPVIATAFSSSRDQEIARMAGDAYSFITWGSVVGALAAGFVLLPAIGLSMTNMVAAWINFSLAGISFLMIKDRRFMALTALAALGAIAFATNQHNSGVSFGLSVADNFESYEAFKHETKDLISLYDKEGTYGRVQVFKDPNAGGSGPVRFIVSDGRFEGSTGADVMSMKALVYLPLAIDRHPKSLLNIGLGTGATLAAAARDKRLRSIDSVEINPLVYEAVDKYFQPGLFADRRVRAISDDARHYLAYTEKKYDVIVSQPSHPTRKVASHLFTKEFYDIAYKRTSKDGIFVQWLPRYLLAPREIKSAIKTLATVFPNLYLWNFGSTDIFLVAAKSSRRIDPLDIDNRIRTVDPNVWGWTYSVGQDEVAAAVTDASIKINTDDLPSIEFSAAKNRITGAKTVRARSAPARMRGSQ